MTQPGGNPVRLHAVVRGLVQGVGYRVFARRMGVNRGLRGYVRNLPDGSVEVIAEGDRPALEGLLTALRHGPSSAEVEDVEVSWSAGDGTIAGFTIRH